MFLLLLGTTSWFLLFPKESLSPLSLQGPGGVGSTPNPRGGIRLQAQQNPGPLWLQVLVQRRAYELIKAKRLDSRRAGLFVERDGLLPGMLLKD